MGGEWGTRDKFTLLFFPWGEIKMYRLSILIMRAGDMPEGAWGKQWRNADAANDNLTEIYLQKHHQPSFPTPLDKKLALFSFGGEQCIIES